MIMIFKVLHIVNNAFQDVPITHQALLSYLGYSAVNYKQPIALALYRMQSMSPWKGTA